MNMCQPLPRTNNSTEKRDPTIRIKASSGSTAPAVVSKPKEPATVPLRQPVEKTVAPFVERFVAKAVSPPATVVSTASHGGGIFGANTTKALSGGGGAGVAGGSSHGNGESQGGAVPGQPGEVGFGTVTGISYAHQVKPVYPTLAKRFNREGKVLLKLTVSDTGALVNVEVIEDPGYGFASAAVDAVRKSRYNPARREGKPFTAKAFLPVRFTLSSGE
ncbi:MAG: energy transducer TonB [Desulfuromonadales bacterium]|nr:energy transducer TonB [Desulfuromonadales bacterium]